ncbi:MAG: hypothetical protein WD271_00825 [Acidimicrobiia bacterium]
MSEWVVVTRDSYEAWETMFAAVDDSGVWIEYIVLPYLFPPAIVIRQYH